MLDCCQGIFLFFIKPIASESVVKNMFLLFRKQDRIIIQRMGVPGLVKKILTFAY